MTPEIGVPAAADLTDPGSWNRYAYVGDDPIGFNDPLGTNKVYPPQDPNQFCNFSPGLGPEGGTVPIYTCSSLPYGRPSPIASDEIQPYRQHYHAGKKPKSILLKPIGRRRRPRQCRFSRIWALASTSPMLQQRSFSGRHGKAVMGRTQVARRRTTCSVSNSPARGEGGVNHVSREPRNNKFVLPDICNVGTRARKRPWSNIRQNWRNLPQRARSEPGLKPR